MQNTKRYTRPIVIIGAILVAGGAAGAVSYAAGGSPEKSAAPAPVVVASAAASPTASPSPSAIPTPTQAPTQVAAPAPAQQDTQAPAPAPNQTKAYTPPAPVKPKAPAPDPKPPAPAPKLPTSSEHVEGSNASITSVRYTSCTSSGGMHHVSFVVNFTDGPWAMGGVNSPYPGMTTFNDGSRTYAVPGPYVNFPC